jgi:hypothetical protein
MCLKLLVGNASSFDFLHFSSSPNHLCIPKIQGIPLLPPNTLSMPTHSNNSKSSPSSSLHILSGAFMSWSLCPHNFMPPKPLLKVPPTFMLLPPYSWFVPVNSPAVQHLHGGSGTFTCGHTNNTFPNLYYILRQLHLPCPPALSVPPISSVFR